MAQRDIDYLVAANAASLQDRIATERQLGAATVLCSHRATLEESANYQMTINEITRRLVSQAPRPTAHWSHCTAHGTNSDAKHNEVK